MLPWLLALRAENDMSEIQIQIQIQIQKDTNTNSTVGTKCLWVGDSDNALSLTEQTTLPCLQTCMNCLAFYGTHVYIQMVTAWPKIKVLNIIWGYRRL